MPFRLFDVSFDSAEVLATAKPSNSSNWNSYDMEFLELNFAPVVKTMLPGVFTVQYVSMLALSVQVHHVGL
jgi:hypothetical protein